MNIEKFYLAFPLVIPVMLFLGCGGGQPQQPAVPTAPPKISSISIVSGDNQSATVGTSLPQAPTVRVSDQLGKPVVGAVVQWSVTSGGGILDHVSSLTTSGGNASIGWTLGTQVGTNILIAASGSLSPVTFNATGTAGPVASIRIAPSRTPIETGDVLQLTAAAADAYGNELQLPLPAPLTWTSSDTSIAKVTLDGFLVALMPGATSVSATSGNLTGSLTLTIDPGITFAFGAEETVFDYTNDRCETLDLPDVPAHVVRFADGSLALMAADAPRNYVMVGADFPSLHRVCGSPALVSDDNYYPETYDNWEWIHSIYLESGVVHALITNEYHDPFAPNCSPGYTGPGNPCWYNSITYAYSTDGGLTFGHANPPGHVVAPPWQKWDASGTPYAYGYFMPSNITLGPGNFYYSVFMRWDRNDGQGLCLMRTHTLGDPSSWRTWDGTGFGFQMTSPYVGPVSGGCKAVISDPNVVGQATITYNTYLNKYMMVGGSRAGGPNEYVCGFFYSLSSDLIDWTPVRLLRTAYVPWSSECYPYGVVGNVFPSVIDHNDTSTNFEKPGQNPYLYYTRFNDRGYDRDLVRVPMTITAQ